MFPPSLFRFSLYRPINVANVPFLKCSIEVTGEYTGEKRQKLILLCSPRESVMVKKHVASVDRNALVTVIHVDNVWGRGEGFGDIQKEM